MDTIKLDKQTISEITDRLLTARKNNLKQVLDIAHRLDTVATHEGVDYIDDSKASSVEASLYSLSCVERPIVWLLATPELPRGAERCRPLVKEKVKAILYMGPTMEDSIAETFVDVTGSVSACKDFEDMLEQAGELLEEGDALLFSPASRSEPFWSDFRERGDAFQKAVRAHIQH